MTIGFAGLLDGLRDIVDGAPRLLPDRRLVEIEQQLGADAHPLFARLMLVHCAKLTSLSVYRPLVMPSVRAVWSRWA